MRRMIPLLAAVLILLSALAWAAPVRADIAPPPPPEGANIFPNAETTQVRMVAETVVIAPAQNTYGQKSTAAIQASFQMRNLGEQAEEMDVRFPLNVLYPMYQTDLNTCAYTEAYPEISDFQAVVDGKSARVWDTVQNTNGDVVGREPKDVKCWANFHVAFPPQTDVNIEVRYTVEAYAGWSVPGTVQFPYVTVTGAAWKDTIGSMDIIYRLPFDLNEQNLADYFPGDDIQKPKMVRNQLSWHFDNIEPGYNFSVSIVNPGLWQRIQREQATLKQNPNDGEAWGRLGRWYKEAILRNKGYRFDAVGEKMYRLSKEAYTKAVTLKPKDADWHAGFADLLFGNVIFQQYGSNEEKRDDLVTCVDQLRQSLAINPRQSLALDLTARMVEWNRWDQSAIPAVVQDGTKFDYPLLTTTPTVIPTEIQILTSTPESGTAAAAATAPVVETPAPTATASPTAQVAAAQATKVPPQPPAPTATTAPLKKPGGICGAAALPGLALAAVWVMKRRK